jgi:alcohol dehydrogenase class IV
MEFGFYTAPKILFKKGAIKELAKSIEGLGTRFLIVSDPFFKNSKHLEIIVDQVKSINGKAIVFSDVFGEPTVELVDEIHEIAIAESCDAVIALGGGSVIDAAKAVAATLTNGIPVIDYMEYVGKGKKVVNPPVPFIAIPTTAGQVVK